MRGAHNPRLCARQLTVGAEPRQYQKRTRDPEQDPEREAVEVKAEAAHGFDFRPSFSDTVWRDTSPSSSSNVRQSSDCSDR